MSSRAPFLCLSYISFLAWLVISCLRFCIFGGVYTLWSGLGTLWSELLNLRSLCYLVLVWGRYDSWDVGSCEPLMFELCGKECARLRWVCGGLGLGQCPFSKCIFCIFEVFVNVSSTCGWHPGWFFYWSCNPLTASMRCLDILVASSFGFSIGTWLCCGYSLYWPETRIPPVVGTCNFRHL